MTAPRLPDFLVLGQGKAGTSLMYRVLAENPEIGVSRPKELHFFSNRFDKGLDWYRSHFDHVADSAKRVGDISPSYLKPEAIDRIVDTFGRNIQVIFILRRPIERFYSRYLQNICAREKPSRFGRLLKDLPDRLTMQIDTLARCYELFGSDNVLPLFYETDIVTFGFEQKVLSFLGLPDADFSAPFRDGGKVNSGVMPRYLYGGETGQEVTENGATYLVPARSLVFCAQSRNSRIQPDVSQDEADKAFETAATWAAEVTRRQYARAQEAFVLPAAARLEQEFGFDMAHWRNPPERLHYDPAPIPESLRITTEVDVAPDMARVAATARPPVRLGLKGTPFLKSLHLSQRLGAVYVNNPKVACSSIKLTLQQTELGDDAYQPATSVHDHAGSPLLTWPDLSEEQAEEALRSGFTFTFVRNPYDRLRSAYLNKIVRPQKQGSFRISAGFGPDELPPFGDFVRALADQPAERHNPHWRCQALNLSTDRIAYDFVGRLECFDADWADLAGQIGVPARASFAGKSTGKAQKMELSYSPVEAEVVRQIYAADFRLFGYDPDPSGDRFPATRPKPGK